MTRKHKMTIVGSSGSSSAWCGCGWGAVGLRADVLLGCKEHTAEERLGRGRPGAARSQIQKREEQK